MIEIVGWVAGLLFAFCGAPQAYKSYKEGHSSGISSLLLWMWGSGELLMIVYVLGKHGLDLPLLVNYIMNLFFVLIITKYKIFPKEGKNESK